MTRFPRDMPSRRRFLRDMASGVAGTTLSLVMADEALRMARGDGGGGPAPTGPPAKVKRAIWLFMGGAPSQIDLFDHKPGLAALYNQELPPSVRGTQRLTGMTAGQARLPIAPSRFPFAQGGASGAWVSDLLPWTRKMVDDLAIVTTVNTESINHEPGLLNIHTGSEQPGKPSLGAWLSYALGPLSHDLPAYVVMTQSSPQDAVALSVRLWSSAFLSAEHAAVPFRSVGDPVLYLANPPGIDRAARRTMLDALAGMNEIAAGEFGTSAPRDRTAQYELAFRLQGSIPPLTDFSDESAATLALYGDDVHQPGSFASNCLMARRMMEQGVRFVQVYHRGWDAHHGLTENHTRLCREIDQACYGLVSDLKQRGLLEDTLVIWGGEFGRTVYCQGTLSAEDYGRDHHPRCFSMWLAGAGIRQGIVYGKTDDFSYNVVENPMSIHDLHATVLHLFGLDAGRLTFLNAGLEERLIGQGAASVISGLLA